MSPDELHYGVRVFAILNLGVVAVSHILAPRAWAEFFILLRAQGRPGSFAVAFMALFFGSIIAGFHNVWTWPWAILALVGWAQVLKAFVYFAFPGFGVKQLETVSADRSWIFVLGGAFLLAVAGAMAAVLLGWVPTSE
jgi:hypothetical protein